MGESFHLVILKTDGVHAKSSRQVLPRSSPTGPPLGRPNFPGEPSMAFTSAKVGSTCFPERVRHRWVYVLDDISTPAMERFYHVWGSYSSRVYMSHVGKMDMEHQSNLRTVSRWVGPLTPNNCDRKGVWVSGTRNPPWLC